MYWVCNFYFLLGKRWTSSKDRSTTAILLFHLLHHVVVHSAWLQGPLAADWLFHRVGHTQGQSPFAQWLAFRVHEHIQHRTVRYSGYTAGLPDRWARGRAGGLSVVFPSLSYHSDTVLTLCPKGERIYTFFFTQNAVVDQTLYRVGLNGVLAGVRTFWWGETWRGVGRMSLIVQYIFLFVLAKHSVLEHRSRNEK